METHERKLGAFLGLAVGDALGATLEFMDRQEIRRRYPGGLREIVGGGPFGWRPGETTDDTAMALCVARGILKAGPGAPLPALVDAVGREFVRWADTGPKDIGGTCRRAIAAYQQVGDWNQASGAVRRALGGHAAGNGGLMRTLPVSLFWHDELKRMVEISRALTRMTHPHPEAEWCSAAYNIYIAILLRGDPPDEAWNETAVLITRLAPDLGAVTESLASRMARAGDLPDSRVRPTGYCVDTLEAALWSFWTTDSAETCIVRAANLGGDADTVAAVAGGLAGAHYGASGLPARWLDRLDPAVRGEIEGTAEIV